MRVVPATIDGNMLILSTLYVLLGDHDCRRDTNRGHLEPRMFSKPFFSFRVSFLPYFLMITISQLFELLTGRWLFVPLKDLHGLRKHTILLTCQLLRGRIDYLIISDRKRHTEYFNDNGTLDSYNNWD